MKKIKHNSYHLSMPHIVLSTLFDPHSNPSEVGMIIPTLQIET